MSSKKKNTTNASSNLTTLKVGSRVHCTDDGVTGHIVWANATAVKIKWDDGEAVTWKRDSLAARPIEIRDADSDDGPTTTPAATDAAAEITAANQAEQPAAPVDTAAIEPTATTEQFPEEATTATPEQPQAGPETTLCTADQPQAEPKTITVTVDPTTALAVPTPERTATEPPTAEAAAPISEVTVEQATLGAANDTAATAAKSKRQRKAPSDLKEKKLSALDAAAKVLAEEGRPMTCKEMIAAMTAKGYWTSPGGQTPDATLYTAVTMLPKCAPRGGLSKRAG
jgi:preprotein translocase subunit YajC